MPPPSSLMAPPSVLALLPVKVAPMLSMMRLPDTPDTAPPKEEVALLFRNVLAVVERVIVEASRPTAPPEAAVLIENVVPEMVRVPPLEATAPPAAEAVLFDNTLSVMVKSLESTPTAPPLPPETEFIDHVVPALSLVTVLEVSAYTAPPPTTA
eukprot:2627911-Rhodomonas_salina.1